MDKYYREAPFNDLIGKDIFAVTYTEDDETIIFYTNIGVYSMFHDQDWCESVYLLDGGDDVIKLNGVVEEAEEVTNSNIPPASRTDESYLWTFYKIATRDVYVVLRWYGHSNGYYSERVTFAQQINTNE